MIDPIYVLCHLCHSDPGEPCRKWARPEGGYCDRRWDRAKVVGARIDEHGVYRGPSNLATEHALAHGALCTDHKPGSVCRGICTQCGLDIRLLRLLRDSEGGRKPTS